VLTTKVTHLGRLLFRQPDGVNCVVRSLFWGCPKTEQCSQWHNWRCEPGGKA